MGTAALPGLPRYLIALLLQAHSRSLTYAQRQELMGPCLDIHTPRCLSPVHMLAELPGHAEKIHTSRRAMRPHGPTPAHTHCSPGVQGTLFEGLVSLHEEGEQGRKCMDQGSRARLVSMLPAVGTPGPCMAPGGVGQVMLWVLTRNGGPCVWSGDVRVSCSHVDLTCSGLRMHSAPGLASIGSHLTRAQ